MKRPTHDQQTSLALGCAIGLVIGSLVQAVVLVCVIWSP